MSCLYETLLIATYPNPDELLNKRSELVSKRQYENKFLLKNLKAMIDLFYSCNVVMEEKFKTVN